MLTFSVNSHQSTAGASSSFPAVRPTHRIPARTGRLFAQAFLILAAQTLAAPAAPAAAPANPDAPLPALGVLVAQTFLRAVAEGDLRTAWPLCAETVDFDGELIAGAEKVRARLEQIKKRVKEGRQLSRIVVMRLARAIHLFGPPPARLTLPKGADLLVGFGRFPRGGVIVFLAPEEDRWRVVALTD